MMHVIFLQEERSPTLRLLVCLKHRLQIVRSTGCTPRLFDHLSYWYYAKFGVLPNKLLLNMLHHCLLALLKIPIASDGDRCKNRIREKSRKTKLRSC